MKRWFAVTVALTFTMAATTVASAQDYSCPFGRDRGYSAPNLELSAQYPKDYRPSEYRDGLCPYEAHRLQQQLTSQGRKDGTLSGRSRDPRTPTREQADYGRSRTSDLRSDFGDSPNDSRCQEYDRRNDYARPTIYQQQKRFDQPSTFGRSRYDVRPLTSSPPATFGRSPMDSRARLNTRGSIDDFRRHEHDGTCNHGPTSNSRQLVDHGTSDNLTPSYNPPRQQRFNSPQPRSSAPISQGPPPLPPQT